MLLQTSRGILRLFFEDLEQEFAEFRNVDRDQGHPEPQDQRSCARMPPLVVEIHQPQEVRHDALSRGDRHAHVPRGHTVRLVAARFSRRGVLAQTVRKRFGRFQV